MTTTYKHTFQHADGRIDKRESVSRIYTHAVVVTYGTLEQLIATIPSYFGPDNRAKRIEWSEKWAGKQVVVSWSSNLKNATNAARAVKLTGYYVKAEVGECQMVEHVSKSRKAAL